MTHSQRLRVAVVFGGKSPEHEVSVITGVQVLKQIDPQRFDAFPLYIAKNGEWYIGEVLSEIETYKNLAEIPDKATRVLPSVKNGVKGVMLIATKQRFSLFSQQDRIIPIDAIFPALHGGIGESGGLQGTFEVMDVPYVGSGILASALSMDKIIMKQLFEEQGLPFTKWMWFYRNEWEGKREDVLQRIGSLTYPLFVKPANGGSSIGVSKVKNEKELENAIEVAAVFDRKIVVEEGFEDAREINISVLGNSGSELTLSVCEEVFSSAELLTYDDKYKGNSKKTGSGMAATRRKIPAELSKNFVDKVEQIARDAYQTLDCLGLARIDFLVNEKTKEIKILEINTIPGSMAFYLWEASGVSFQELTSRLIDLAIERYSDAQKNTTTFSSNILANFPPRGIKTTK